VRKLLAVFLVSFIAGGCASPAPTKSVMNKIHVGKTTRAEVHQILGAPTTPGRTMEVWEYDLIDGKKPSISIGYRTRKSVPEQKHKVVEKVGRNLPEEAPPEGEGEKKPAKAGK